MLDIYIKFCKHSVSREVKYVEFSLIECSNRPESDKNELYGRYNSYIKNWSRFKASILHFQLIFEKSDICVMGFHVILPCSLVMQSGIGMSTEAETTSICSTLQ